MSDGATDMMREEQREAAKAAILMFATQHTKLFVHKAATVDDLITISQMALTEARRLHNERPA